MPRPVGPKTLENIRGTLRAALADALYTDEPLITGEIWKAAKFTKPQDHQTVPPDIDQFWALLDLAAGHRLYPLMPLAGNAGLRRGELAGLKWEDINLDTGQLTVNRQRKSIEYRVVVAEAKTEAGQRRTVMLGDHTSAASSGGRRPQDAEREAWGLGNASVQITSKIYSALFNAAKAKMAAAAEALVWKDRAVPTGPVKTRPTTQDP